jgi:predicted membrane protein
MFDREVVYIVVAGYIVDHYCLRFDREVIHIIVAGYAVDHYCLRFDRGVVHIVVSVILLTISFSRLIEEWFILLCLLYC